jgi:tripartite-type tricarboxylate transporter receptor subunit TctC
MNHSSSELAQSLTDVRDALLLEVENIPDEQIPQLLQIIRLFRQSQMTNQESVDNWEKAMVQLEKSDPIQRKRQQQKLKQLFQSWNELNEEQDQKETWEIIKSFKGVSI